MKKNLRDSKAFVSQFDWFIANFERLEEFIPFLRFLKIMLESHLESVLDFGAKAKGEIIRHIFIGFTFVTRPNFDSKIRIFLGFLSKRNQFGIWAASWVRPEIF